MNKMLNFFGGGNGAGNMGGMNGGNGGPFGNFMGMFNKFQQFMNNPMGAFMSSGLNIPQNIQGNPEAITNYLRSSGRMTDEQYNQCAQMAQWAQNMFGKNNR